MELRDSVTVVEPVGGATTDGGEAVILSVGSVPKVPPMLKAMSPDEKMLPTPSRIWTFTV